MMYDPLKRAITYLRISVTDRCNLRCTYCMPEEGIPLVDHSEILTFNEIEEFTRVAVSNGVNKVRITGGEPLVRKGITELVRRLASIEGITDLSMTTNGQLLSQFAEELAKAGLMRINISLDTADPDRYREITRGGDINKVFDGIEAAKRIRSLPRRDAKGIPIIAMTANAFTEDIQMTRDAGMNAHISKPIETEKLYDTLASLLKIEKLK